MKKRYLRKSIETTLTIITMIMIMLTVMLHDFEVNLTSITILGLWFTVLAINIYTLNRWGRLNWLEKK